MKLIYSQGFSKSERLDWKPVVFSNIVQSFRTIHEAMTELNYEFDNPDNEVSQCVRYLRCPCCLRLPALRNATFALPTYADHSEIHGPHSRRP